MMRTFADKISLSVWLLGLLVHAHLVSTQSSISTTLPGRNLAGQAPAMEGGYKGIEHASVHIAI